MSRLWQPRGYDVYKSLIDTILEESSDKLSEWETNFIESISNQLESKRTLSEKQETILENIYVNKTH